MIKSGVQARMTSKQLIENLLAQLSDETRKAAVAFLSVWDATWGDPVSAADWNARNEASQAFLKWGKA